MEFEQIKKILDKAASEAGLSEYDIYYKDAEDISCETLKNEISTFTCESTRGICFRCVVNGKFGYASSEKIDEDELKQLVAKAAENAKYIESEDKAILYRGGGKYKKVSNEILPMPSSGDLKKLALDIQKKTYEESEYVTDGTQSSVNASHMTVDFCNSYGLSLHKEISARSAFAEAVVSKNGESEDDYDFTMGKDFGDIGKISEKAVSGALSKIGAEVIDSGSYDVIIDGEKMAVLLSTFSGAFSAKNVELGLSRLKGKMNEKIASEIVTITDDPFSEKLIGPSPFDAEGVPTYTKTVIENGILKTFLYNLATADKAGCESTGNASKGGYASTIGISPYYFSIRPGNVSFDDLLENVGNGVYITELKGLHAGANAVTGDFSIESAGFRIENGKIGKAVKSFTIAGNFFDLLGKIDALSDEVKGNPGISCAFGAPDVLIKKMSIAGK